MCVPADPPGRFANRSLDALVDELSTDKLEVAKAVLAEAEAIYAEPFQRIDSAERRATTLQGTVAIAASVAIAGGGLLIDPSRIKGADWRTTFALLLVGFVACLLACALRATAATSRIFQFEEPGIERILERSKMSEAQALTARAAELLRAFAVADEIGLVKVGLLRAAVWWFRVALVFLGLVALSFGAYSLVRV